MSAILALARKDLALLFRNKGHLFFSFGWPLLVAVLFGFLYGGPKPGASAIPVAVVDEDATAGSAGLVERLSSTRGLAVVTMSRDEALAAVRRGAKVAAVVIPKGYGTASERLFYGTPATLEVAIDPSRQAEASMLEGLLMGASMEGLQRLFSDQSASTSMVDRALADVRRGGDAENRAQLERFLGELRQFVSSPAAQSTDGGGAGEWQPLVIEKTDVSVLRSGPPNGFMVTFPQGAIWGVIGCAFGFALSLVIERTRGTLTRLQMAPISRANVLAGKALACFATILIVQTLLFALGYALLDVVPASLPLLVLASVCVAAAFVGIMMLISVLGRTEQTVGGAAWAVLLPMSLFGGGMVPLFVMPAWMQTVSHASPVKWGILAMEGALWRGFTLSQMLLPCAILVGVGVVGFLVGARLFARSG